MRQHSGPLRNGDAVLLNEKVLTARSTSACAQSYALLPEDGYCFISKDGKDEFPVRLLRRPATGSATGGSPCVAPPPLRPSTSAPSPWAPCWTCPACPACPCAGAAAASPAKRRTRARQPSDKGPHPGAADGLVLRRHGPERTPDLGPPARAQHSLPGAHAGETMRFRAETAHRAEPRRPTPTRPWPSCTARTFRPCTRRAWPAATPSPAPNAYTTSPSAPATARPRPRGRPAPRLRHRARRHGHNRSRGRLHARRPRCRRPRARGGCYRPPEGDRPWGLRRSRGGRADETRGFRAPVMIHGCVE